MTQNIINSNWKGILFQSGKRIFDITFSLCALIIFLPIMIVISCLIWYEDKGPILFIQERTGKNGELFHIYKFRSMYVAKRNQTYVFEEIKGVPDDFIFKNIESTNNEVTKIGNFIRKTSLDELPQFFNSLLGNMSVIGPRPEIPAISDHYNEVQRKRLLVKPGITGLAQVSGRSELTNGKKMEYDLFYIKNQSPKLESKILLKTVVVVFLKEGAI